MRTIVESIVGSILLASVVATALPAGAATTADLLRCQKGLHSRAAAFEKVLQLRLSTCALKVEYCQLAEEIDGDDATACLTSVASACSAYSAKVAQYKSIYSTKALFACTSVQLGQLEQSVAGLGFAPASASCAATSESDLIECVFDAVQCSAERTLFALDPRAGDALATAGIAAAHPCVGP